MIWSTGHEFCRAIDCAAEPEPWRRKYRDYLQFQYQGRGRLKADGRRYDIMIDLWLLPMLDRGTLAFEATAWKVKVSRGIWRRRIEREIADAVRDVFEGSLGEQVTLAVAGILRQAVGTQRMVQIMTGNTQLIVTHPCVSLLQRIGYPGHAYTPDQLRDICGGHTPGRVAAPAIRLLKR